MSRPLSRLATLFVIAALALPAAAHDGMTLSGNLHRLLHTVGTDTVLALGAVVLAVTAAAVLRRAARRSARRAPD